MTAPRRIRPLADSLINQIAAGEVIERPASIVKELVENSLDAGAGSIDVECTGGGIERIAVRDDGHGIERDDLVFALARHCTSKLARASELEAIASLGFRGEALASIAAVAALELTSRRPVAPHAWQVSTNPDGAPGPVRPAPHGSGTSVVVRDLFARIPARRRFLKRPATEQLHILQLVRRLGFCVPAVGLSLVQDGRRVLALPAAADERTAERRWRALFGLEFARDARYVERSVDGMRLFGWIGGPGLARSQADLQWLSVNGRLVRDRQLAHGIRLAFGDGLPDGRFAAYALHLELPPTEVDVNVHPGKIEVRFARLRDVHDLVLSVTREALRRDPYPVRPGDRRAPAPGIADASDAGGVSDLGGARHVGEAAGVDASPDVAAAAGMREPLPPASSSGRAPARTPLVVALVGGRYLLELAGDVLLVHAAGQLAAAVARRRLRVAGRPPAARPLLFPIRLGDEHGRLGDEEQAALAALGFAADRVGPRSHVLRTMPTLVPELDPERFARALVAAFESAAPTALDAVCHAIAEGVALPAAIEERGAWLGRLVEQAAMLGIDATRYRARLDAEALARLLPSGLESA